MWFFCFVAGAAACWFARNVAVPMILALLHWPRHG